MIDDLPHLLPRIEPAVAPLLSGLVDRLADLAPGLRGAARINWGSITYHDTGSRLVFTLLPMSDHIAMVFEEGARLASPLLSGSGSMARVLKCADLTVVHGAEFERLVASAIAPQP